MSAAASIPATSRRPLDRPFGRARAQLGGASRVRVEEALVGEPFFEEEAMQRERDRQIGAGTRRQVQVRLPRERRRPRIDHDQRGAGLLRLLARRGRGECPTRTG